MDYIFIYLLLYYNVNIIVIIGDFFLNTLSFETMKVNMIRVVKN